jgi:hypothetical protein
MELEIEHNLHYLPVANIEYNEKSPAMIEQGQNS